MGYFTQLFALSDFATVGLALVVSVLAPSFLAFVNALIQKKDKQADWERQDALTSRLDEIHTLVNSSLTAQMEDALVSKEAELVALKALQHDRTRRGERQDDNSSVAIASVEAVVKRKKADLRERQRETDRAAAQKISTEDRKSERK